MKCDRRRLVFCLLLLAVFTIFLGYGTFRLYRHEKSQNIRLQRIEAQAQYSGNVQRVILPSDISGHGFYEKLAEGGYEVNILVIGDSIGAGYGVSSEEQKWTTLLPSWIDEQYHVTCRLTNISMDGNTSYAGNIRTKLLDDGIQYDLAILCYGQNDSDDERFSFEYEGIIRSVRTKYQNCEIICILEHSQRDYTSKIKQIMEIAEYYGLSTADTIAAFNNHPEGYEALVHAPDDMTHPNDRGYEIYFETLRNIIAQNVESVVRNPEVLRYDAWGYVPVSDFNRIDQFTWRANISNPMKADIGLYRIFLRGEDNIRIMVDDVLVIDSPGEWRFGTQPHIHQITEEPIEIREDITIIFSSEELADGFYGLVLTNVTSVDEG